MDPKGMTVREAAGPMLLSLLLILGLAVSRHLGRQQETVARELENCSWLALSGHWSDAREGADLARQKWEEGWDLRAVFGDHTPMEDIDDLFAQLQVCAAAGERTEFARISAALAGRIRAVGEAHRLSWKNIL